MTTEHNILFKCMFGSHLHGTNTPASDVDMKAIFKAPLSDIVLGRVQDNHVHSTGGKGKNTEDDVDIEYIELRKFIKDIGKGQTYALEMLNANEESILVTTPTFQELQDNRDKLITSNVKPFVGYCVSQAKKYGLKGSRLRATESALAHLETFPQHIHVEEALEGLELNEYVFLVRNKLKGQDEPVQLLEVNGKQFNMNIPLRRVCPVLKALLENYGERARRAKEGVDWKAVSHAYRVIYELREILTTGRIQFPLKEREFLKAVKLGQVPYTQIQEELPLLIEEVDQIESTLPTTIDTEYWDGWLLKQYLSP